MCKRRSQNSEHESSDRLGQQTLVSCSHECKICFSPTVASPSHILVIKTFPANNAWVTSSISIRFNSKHNSKE